MDIEQLTKAQIVLLTLLVSFITSIATGIVTVSLMDQAPPAMTQVVNRVVERTVERVVPEEISSSVGRAVTAALPPKQETTVVVKENELITDAVEQNAATLFRIHKKGDSRSTLTPGALIGMGFLVTASGMVATDGAYVTPKGEYVVVTSTGENFTARALPKSDSPVGFLLIEDVGATFSAAKLANPDGLKLGQSVVALSYGERLGIAVGIVTDVERSSGETPAVTKIRTDIQDARVAYGSPIVTIFGDVIGVHVAELQSPGSASFAPLRLPSLTTQSTVR